MIKTISMLLDELAAYQDPYGKINRLCLEKKLFQLTRGVYTTDENVSGYCFAPVIYGPSHLSFDFALARYGLIPEAVHTYTSATCLKGKKKVYHNCFGDYSYRDIPVAAFSLGIELCHESGYLYTIATPEKALCDKLYTVTPLKNMRELEALLFGDLRIEESEFWALKLEDLLVLAPYYHSTNLKLLEKLLRRYARRQS